MFISACRVGFSYPGAVNPALGDISFQPGAGQLCCLAGANGSGKSTLLALLAGLYAPTGGELRLSGLCMPDKNRQSKAALVPQNPDAYILGSLVQEDLFLALDARDEEARRRALDLAGDLGLADLLHEPVHMLSHGQKRKLCLASALAAGPRLLLLDEPFAGLDHPAVLALRALLAAGKAAGLTQILTGHDLDLMADLADVFILLDKGRLVCSGAAAEVFPLMPAAGVRPPCWWFTGASGPLWLDG